MDFLYFLEGIRIPVLNEIMLFVTQLGEETAFLVVAMIIFWCIDKHTGYYILSVGFMGTLSNQFLKLVFRVPRPWVIDSNFTILEQARETAAGYSFPSGHAQSAVCTFGSIAYTSKKKWIRISAISIAFLVPFSRMYIGVHTPADVLVAAALAIVFIVALKPIVLYKSGEYIPMLLGIMTFLSVAFILFVKLFPFPSDIDAHNLASGTKSAYTLFGALLGLIVVFLVDKKWLNFSTKALWWVQLIKVILGFFVVLLVKNGLKAPINAFLGASVGTAVRYFLVVIVAGIVWPLSFKWFGSLGHCK